MAIFLTPRRQSSAINRGRKKGIVVSFDENGVPPYGKPDDFDNWMRKLSALTPS
jgi:hypothetical protein